MATALAGAVSCGRCGRTAGADAHDHCRACGLRWVPAAPGSAVDLDVGLLGGVVRAGIGRRYLGHVLDALPVLVVAAVVVAASLDVLAVTRGQLVLLVAAAIGYLVVQLLLFALAGRSLGRLLLGLRTVDDLTGTPLGFRRLVRQGPAGRKQTVTAAVRQGRDPVDGGTAGLAATLSASIDSAGAAELAARHRAEPADVAPVAVPEPRPSVAIVLGNGERYEIWHSLLLGRSPVDPEGGRALLAWPDLSRRLAKTHVLLEWSGTTLWITDLGTANGTALVSPAGDRTPLVPGVRTATAVGWTVECGGRTFEVRPGGTARPAAGSGSTSSTTALPTALPTTHTTPETTSETTQQVPIPAGGPS